MPLEGCKVVVAGAGIGGMTAGLLLGSVGASVRLLERVAEPAAVGAGLLLQPNGLAVLYALGLGAELQRAAWRTPPAAIRDPTGTVLLALPLPDFGRGLDHALVLRRSHLYGVLLAAVQAHLYLDVTAPPVARALAEQDLEGFRRRWAAALPLAAPALERLGSLDALLVNQVVRVDCQRWADGRLVLVGDAAHAMAPNLGQGANSAIVDAAVLAAELAANRPLPEALARYTLRRRRAVGTGAHRARAGPAGKQQRQLAGQHACAMHWFLRP